MIIDKILVTVSAFIKRTSYCFSAAMLLLAVVGSSLGVDMMTKGLKPTQMFMCFVFSALFAIVFCACDYIKNSIIRRSCQYVFTMISVYIVFISNWFFDSFIMTKQEPFFSSMMLIFIATLIYSGCGVIYLLAKFILSKINKNNKQEEYTAVYKKSKTN